MHIVFTDLDGTLLDHHTYSYREAEPGLALLKKKNIPLVLVSSKTKPEMELIHEELGLESPFIFENGAGIAWYRKGGGKNFSVEYAGCGLAELEKNRGLLEDILGFPVTTIREMDAGEIAAKTGLSVKIAAFSRMRVASLPFLIPEGKKIDARRMEELNRTLGMSGFALTRGGRFFHFLSDRAGKGHAVKRIIGRYQDEKGLDNIVTMALGDSENDISMLEAAGARYLVRRHDGSVIETLLRNVKVTEGIGPAGFTEAIMNEIG